CAENPHCGKSGVPFMNNTTGLEASSALILSITSIAANLTSPATRSEHLSRPAHGAPHVSFGFPRYAPFRQRLDDSPLLGRAHGKPARNFIDRPQAADAQTLRIQRTNLHT